jgi:hypothetical protein
MRFVPFLLALAACGEVHQVHRWPGHRRERDEQIEALENQARTLETRMRRLEQQLWKLQQVPQPASGALPSPGT